MRIVLGVGQICGVKKNVKDYIGDNYRRDAMFYADVFGRRL